MLKIKNTATVIIALTAILQALAFSVTIPQPVYYGIISVAIIFVLINSRSLNLNWTIIFFIGAAILSLILNTVPPIFKAQQRLIAFILILSLVGPLINSNYSYSLKLSLFNYLNKIILFLASASFLTYLLGISLGITGKNAGLFNHSMMLGPIAGVSLINAIYLKTKLKNKQKSKKIIFVLNFTLILLFLSLLISSSRAAIIGTVVGIIFYFYKLYQSRFSKFYKTIFSISLLILISFPLWADYTTGVINKMEYSQSQNDFAASRRDHWGKRLSEFNSSPVYGIGFATVDVKSGKFIDWNKENGGIEPGTSWISILSMTGILGFIPIVIFFLIQIRFIINNKENIDENAVLGGILFFFITHMFAEGYFLAAGGLLTFYVWLLLGIINGYKKYKFVEIFKEC